MFYKGNESILQREGGRGEGEKTELWSACFAKGMREERERGV
jgi:hypothetical protein